TRDGSRRLASQWVSASRPMRPAPGSVVIWRLSMRRWLPQRAAIPLLESCEFRARACFLWSAAACRRFGVRQLAAALGWAGYRVRSLFGPPHPSHPKARASSRTPKRQQAAALQSPGLSKGRRSDAGVAAEEGAERADAVEADGEADVGD